MTKRQICREDSQQYSGDQQTGNSHGERDGMPCILKEGFGRRGDRFGDRFRIRRWVSLFGRAALRQRLIGVLRSGDEGITPARNGLDKRWLIRGIAERLAQFVDGGVDVCVVVDLRIRRPQARPQRFACNHVARLLQQNQEHFQDLSRQSYPQVLAEQLLAV